MRYTLDMSDWKCSKCGLVLTHRNKDHSAGRLLDQLFCAACGLESYLTAPPDPITDDHVIGVTGCYGTAEIVEAPIVAYEWTEVIPQRPHLTCLDGGKKVARRFGP